MIGQHAWLKRIFGPSFLSAPAGALGGPPKQRSGGALGVPPMARAPAAVTALFLLWGATADRPRVPPERFPEGIVLQECGSAGAEVNVSALLAGRAAVVSFWETD